MHRMLHSTFRNPCGLGKPGSTQLGAWKSKSRWLGWGPSLQTSQATAPLSLSFGREGARLSRARGCASILSQCDWRGVDLAGCGAWSRCHMATRLRCLGILFSSLFKWAKPRLFLAIPLWLCESDELWSSSPCSSSESNMEAKWDT